MSNEHKKLWWENAIKKWGSEEAVRQALSERNQTHGNGFKKGVKPHNVIQDEFSDLDISRQRKYLLRKKKYGL